jgi:uncharacterized phage protein (TIGR02220 family)
MKKSKVRNENYIQIQGWMVNELKLSGTELLIYAIIYGFSQDGNSEFTGSLQYLADWTNTSKQTCSSNLKYLMDKNLILKEEFELNDVKYCKYKANLELNTIQKVCIPIQEVCTNNLVDNIDNSSLNKFKEDNVEKQKSSDNDKILKENIKCIIDYLNESIKSNYRYTTKGTVNLIKARFKEGFTLDNFYDVIDKKVKEWYGTDMEKYLRPETLFGNKFEGYLNTKNTFKGSPRTSYSSKSSFDNTKDHDVCNDYITDEEFDKMEFEEKRILFSTKIPKCHHTPKQREFFNQYCLAKNPDGTDMKF